MIADLTRYLGNSLAQLRGRWLQPFWRLIEDRSLRFAVQVRDAVRIRGTAPIAAPEGATSPASGEYAQSGISQPTPFRDRFRDGTGDGPAMVWLPGGTFRMGSPEGIGNDDERPAHEVTLSHFAAGKYPLTVGELRHFVEATGYKTEAEQGGGAGSGPGENLETRRMRAGAIPTWRRTRIIR